MQLIIQDSTPWKQEVLHT